MPAVRSRASTVRHPCADDGWRIPDVLWERIVPLLPVRKPHPLGCHRPRVDDRRAMDAIFFVLRTGCQWNALNATGICSSSSAHRRFQEWVEADRVIQFSVRELTEHGSGAIKRFDPRGGSPGKARPHTSQNALVERLRWDHSPVH